uniref:Pickpocket n=1 Tax=Anopheles farauti TaxID=69004 RepID=A0A182QC31_9DIPT
MAAPATLPIRLYAERAAKFAPRPQTTLTLKRAGTAGLSIFRDYCANSSIHGFKYFVGSGRTRLEKIWWMVMCVLSVYGCGSLIATVYEKWRRDPIVVTFAEKLTPIYDIPFPAVTVCPITKVKSSELNFTSVYQRVVNENASITDEDEFLDDQRYDNNLVDLLEKMAIPFDEIFVVCFWRNQYMDCADLFKATLTEHGICYTFNGLSADDMLKKEEFHKDFEHLGETRSSANWTMEGGYHPLAGLETYPRRVVSSGANAGLVVLLKSDLNDMDYLCGGYQAQIHTPNQCPQISSQSIRVPMEHELSIRVTPHLMTTAANVMSYSPSKRLCYYTHERFLRYFRIYTKRNCELECLANFTLHLCGCVQFSMPRAEGVNICGIEKLDCCDEADAILQEQGLSVTENSSKMVLQACNCLPGCSYLHYKTEISQAHFDWRRLTSTIHLFEQELNHSQLSSLMVYYKESEFIAINRRQLFGLNDFIANCGGILGLFMGVSLLSIVEILYYFTMKPLINHWLKRSQNKQKIATTYYKVAAEQGKNKGANISPHQISAPVVLRKAAPTGVKCTSRAVGQLPGSKSPQLSILLGGSA